MENPETLQQNFIIVDLTQGSTEWLDFKRYKLGASEVSSILGIDPWRTPYALWIEKIEGKQKEDNENMARGRAAEPIIREHINSTYKKNYQPLVAQSTLYPWAIASLDGYEEECGWILEAKAPKKLSLDTPKHHYAQCQYQMFVTGCLQVLYVQYDGEDYSCACIKRDEEFIDRMIIKCEVFYRKLINFEEPELTDRDIFSDYDAETTSLVQQYNLWKDQEERAAATKESLKMAIMEKIEHPKNKIGDTWVYKTVRRGQVDWKSIPILKDYDVEPYRKENTVTWTIK